MSKLTYEISDDNAVKIFNEGQEAPMIFQPTWPDGTAWADAEEASEWAETFIKSIEDPDYEFTIGDGPDQPKKPKPVAPELPAAE